MSTYEKELLALVAAVKKWRPYLIGRFFTIRTDHHSLKFLLEQKIGTPMQQRWVSKLLGYEFVMEYKKRGKRTRWLIPCLEEMKKICRLLLWQ